MGNINVNEEVKTSDGCIKDNVWIYVNFNEYDKQYCKQHVSYISKNYIDNKNSDYQFHNICVITSSSQKHKFYYVNYCSINHDKDVKERLKRKLSLRITLPWLWTGWS